MDLQTLRHELSELAFGYFMAGELNEDWLGTRLAPDGLPTRFREYHRLVDLHLALHPPVVEFAGNLREHLRGIKTETQRERHHGRDAVEGHINWQATYQERYNSAPADRSLFVTDRRTEAYEIPENLVLKKLLAVVYDTVTELEKKDYDWVTDRWEQGDDGGIDEFKRLYTSNIHLNRIPTPEPPLPSDRMIQATKAARTDFYRRAAAFLELREQLRAGDQTALTQLFNSGVIQPPEDTLFELYAVLRLLCGLDTELGDSGRVRPIERGSEALAQVGDPPVYLYHESAARDKGLRFPSLPVPDEEEHDRPFQNERSNEEWLARSRAAAYWTNNIQTEIWGETSDYTGRPDAIVFRPAPDDQDRFASAILVVEVKNSTSKKRINTGISETLRYLAYASKTANGTEFLFPETDDEDAFGAHVHGLLVIQDLETKEIPDSIPGPLSIVQASELADRVPGILGDVFAVGA